MSAVVLALVHLMARVGGLTDSQRSARFATRNPRCQVGLRPVSSGLPTPLEQQMEAASLIAKMAERVAGNGLAAAAMTAKSCRATICAAALVVTRLCVRHSTTLSRRGLRSALAWVVEGDRIHRQHAAEPASAVVAFEWFPLTG